MSRYIITGNLGIAQNVTSTLSWIREYGPLLRREDPEMSLTLAGKNPSPHILKAAEAFGAKVIPSPPDMSVCLSDADIYICPADNGSGIKLRVMDGLKSGLPVVAHVLASRGYEHFIGKNLFVYDDGASFARAVREAREMTGDKEALISSYREFFSFKAGVKRLQEALQQK